MLRDMLALGEYLQIVRGVVELIAVDVVDYFSF